jgi:pilus assembly protein CpaF
MVAMTGLEIPSNFIRRYVSSALDVIIHLARLSDGSRKLISFQEITGMEGEVITLQEIFSFEQMGLDGNGKVRGRFRNMGVRPKFTERFTVLGIAVPDDFFNPTKAFEV